MEVMNVTGMLKLHECSHHAHATHNILKPLFEGQMTIPSCLEGGCIYHRKYPKCFQNFTLNLAI